MNWSTIKYLSPRNIIITHMNIAKTTKLLQNEWISQWIVVNRFIHLFEIDAVTVTLLVTRICDLINCICYYILGSPFHRVEYGESYIQNFNWIDIFVFVLYKIFCNVYLNVYKLDALFLTDSCCNTSSLYDVFHIKCIIDLARKLRKYLRTIVTMLLNFDYILLLGFALWLATFPKNMFFVWILEWQILVLPFN